MNIYIKLTIVACVWGGTFIATRVAAQHLGSFSGAFLRFLFACAGLLVLMALQKQSWPRFNRRDWVQHLLLALTGIIAYNFFFFSALRILPASRASLLVALNPVMVMFATAIFLGGKLRFVQVLGGLLSFTGAVLIIGHGHLGQLFDHFGAGEALALGCPVTWTAYTLISRQISTVHSPLVTTTVVCLAGAAGLLPLALWEGLPLFTLPVEVWLALAYLGLLGTVLGFVWYAEGIRAIGTTRTAIFNNLVPVFGVLFSVLLLHETIYPEMIGGGLLVVLGVTTMNVFGRF